MGNWTDLGFPPGEGTEAKLPFCEEDHKVRFRYVGTEIL